MKPVTNVLEGFPPTPDNSQKPSSSLDDLIDNQKQLIAIYQRNIINGATNYPELNQLLIIAIDGLARLRSA